MSGNARAIRAIVPKPSFTEGQDDIASVKRLTKSRTGCVTCKAKRMKCDETKPVCRQCTRRGIICGGYARNQFKWKRFLNPEVGTQTQSDEPISQAIQQIVTSSPDIPSGIGHNIQSSSITDCFSQALSSLVGDRSFTPELTGANALLSPVAFDWPGGSSSTAVLDLDQPQFDPSLFPQSTDSNDGSSYNTNSNYDLVSEPKAYVGLPNPGWTSGATLDHNGFDNQPVISSLELERISSIHKGYPIYSQPNIEAGHPDVITTLFQRKTCGVLSVEDESGENPWRSLIWPLARKNPALSHAISAMTCLHLCNVRSDLHRQGLDHVRQSIRILRGELENGTIGLDAALATTLALSLAKTWEAPRTSTGFKYLNESKLILKRAVSCFATSHVSPKSARRLSFLADTWIYMDVICRLTSPDLSDSIDIDLMVACSLLEGRSQRPSIDPLMGCAVELFPLIGKAADIVKRVWSDSSKRDTPSTVAQAAETMRAVETWTPLIDLPNGVENACIISDSVQTAEAYRWSTLLVLRQAVPALPSFHTHEEMAQKILVYLATVPGSSGMTIVHAFPLLIAGCEVAGSEEREWVTERWKLMSNRMITGLVERCLEVTTEAWRRKDELSNTRTLPPKLPTARSEPSELTKPSRPIEAEDLFDDLVDVSVDRSGENETPIFPREQSHSIEVEDYAPPLISATNESKTKWSTNSIRSRLNWYAVMHDWKWNIMLG